MTETPLSRLKEELADHRAYMERELQSCEIYLSQYDKPTSDDVATPGLDLEQWPIRVAMMREMRDLLTCELARADGSMEAMVMNMAKAGGHKQQLIARGRAIINAAMFMEDGWEDRADAWLDETGPEGGDA